ncbi:MAG: 7-carboxy-7-deazaguanine synthase [Deltaproteobacteria bacterium]|nr:MAG: 7-carboxy-7-deazaguanine synthase [Deltaproteobacteria bacterium]
MSKLMVSEIFSSLQGESHWAGYPCTFIRLTGCNLRCSWCDTSYAWEGGELRAVSEIVEYAVKAGLPTVEVTGGEPLAQAATLELLVALSKKHPGEILLETNGSLPLLGIDPKVHVIMDLKPPSSGESGSMDWGNLKILSPERDEIKVIIADRVDFEWATEILRKEVAKGMRISFSPLWGAVEPSKLAEWILAEKLPVRMQLQLHKLIWPNKDRGV